MSQIPNDENPQNSARTGFGLLLALLALLAAGKVIVADTMDPDAFWHMRVGGEIARQGWPHPLVDDLSFSTMRVAWTPYSWLAEVGMKRLWDVGGFRVALAVQAAMEAGFLVLLGLGGLELSERVSGKPRYFASAIGTVFGGILSLAYLSFRPVTAAILLLALVGYLLLRDRRLNEKSKAVWFLPVITAVITNLHFFALFVPVWVGALLAGDFLQSRRVGMRGIGLFAGTLVACACTPMLPGTIKIIGSYYSSDIMVRQSTIAEFQPFYRGLMGNISVAFFVFTAVCILWRLKTAPRFPLGEALWFAAMSIFLWRMGRFSPLFAIIGVPAFATVTPGLGDRILARRPIVAALAVVLVMIAIPIARAFPSSNQTFSAWLNRNGTDAPNYPCGAADYVESKIPGQTHHLLCDFTWGGFLEWRLADRFQMFMDGRIQCFSADFWKNAALSGSPERVAYLAKVPADAAIVRVGPGKLRGDLTALKWKPVYRDNFAEVWVPPNSKRDEFANGE